MGRVPKEVHRAGMKGRRFTGWPRAEEEYKAGPNFARLGCRRRAGGGPSSSSRNRAHYARPPAGRALSLQQRGAETSSCRRAGARSADILEGAGVRRMPRGMPGKGARTASAAARALSQASRAGCSRRLRGQAGAPRERSGRPRRRGETWRRWRLVFSDGDLGNCPCAGQTCRIQRGLKVMHKGAQGLDPRAIVMRQAQPCRPAAAATKR